MKKGEYAKVIAENRNFIFQNSPSPKNEKGRNRPGKKDQDPSKKDVIIGQFKWKGKYQRYDGKCYYNPFVITWPLFFGNLY